ncbi:MAG: Type 1 glutamine amidotransferase-like domain-containing protein [Vulcanibacillus sp.]
MKKLILYSDQIQDKSELIDIELITIINYDNPKIGYIPSSSDLNRKYFNQKIEYYEKLGITNLIYFDLEQEFNPNKIKELFSCNAIHLSGGNTFYFLNLLKKRNFINQLLTYVEKGGILIGISAGSILMSETILAASIGDENLVELKDYNALGLVDFDFFPHWNNNDKYLYEIISYSKENKNKVCYVCTDSDGIIVNDDKIILIGDPIKILNGDVV